MRTLIAINWLTETDRTRKLFSGRRLHLIANHETCDQWRCMHEKVLIAKINYSENAENTWSLNVDWHCLIRNIDE